MGSKTMRMFSTTVLCLGLLVVAYTAPVELDESNSQELRFETGDGAKREEGVSQKQIERKHEGAGMVPKKIHSHSGNEGALGNIFPPWKRGDPEPHPNPIPAYKRIKTDNHNIVSRTNLDGTKAVGEANLNRATGDHLPTPPPMPEHKLHRLLTDLKNAGLFAALKRFYSFISKMNADGNYSFDFGSEDGTKVSESGSQRQVGPKPEDIGNDNRGSYSDPFPHNTVVNWVADENGIQAPSDHLPNSNSPPSDGGVGKMLADLKK